MSYRLTARLHVSWLIAVVSVGLFLGVVLAGNIATDLSSIAWLLTGTMLACIACTKQRRYMIIVALLGGGLIGAWRGSFERIQLDLYDSLIGKAVQVEGVMVDDLDINKQGDTVLRLANIRIYEHALPGALWVTTDGKVPAQRSDRLVIEGRLTTGFGTFPAAIYQAEVQKIVRPKPGDIALEVRNWFAGLIRQAIPDPEAALGVGYLVGQRRNLPEMLTAALQTTGLTHIVVASGYNLTILVRFARRFFMRISKYTATIASGGLILSFIAMTGISPSMSRAGLIAGLSLLAWYYGRKFQPLVLLPLAIAITVLIKPSYAWGDVGWQLSFAAFAGVMILAPLLQSYYFGPKKPGMVRQILGETVAATICTLPIILLYFGQMSNIALLANLLVLPLVPLAMLLTFIAGLGALFVPSAASVIGAPAYGLLQYMTATVDTLAAIPWAMSEISISGWQAIGMYAFIATACFYMWRQTKLDLRDTNLVE
jgi:competence protein ComEC